MFLSTQRDQSTYLFPKSLYHTFSIHISSTSLKIQPNHWTQFMNQCIITHLAIPLSKQNKQPSAFLKDLPSGRISVYIFPLGISQGAAGVLQLSIFRDCLCIMHSHLYTRPEYYFPLSNDYMKLPIKSQVQSGEKEGSIARVRTTGIWSTFSYNLLVLSGPAKSQPHHFPLMIEYCCAYSALLLDGQNNPWFMMSSSGHMGTWRSMIKCQFLLRFSSRINAFYKKNSSNPHRMARLCSKITRACAVIN